jgi:hypothetical protein
VTLVRSAISVAAWSIGSSTAFAEVCDKVRPDWSPEDGATGQIDQFVFDLVSPVGIALGILVALSLVTGYRWLYAVAAVFAAITATVTLLSWAELAGFDSVFAASIREGCQAAPYLTLASLAVFAIWSMFKATRAKEEQKC